MSRLSSFTPLLHGDSIEQKRLEIKNYFHNSFELFEKVFELLKDDDVFYEKSEPTRHPMIFYFGHTATFYINKFIFMKMIKERINPQFESIFAVGVDEMSWDEMDSAKQRWPQVSEVRAYRQKVKSLVDSVIDTMTFSLPITQDSPMWIVLMGIEHERIHIETSLVLHRQMHLSKIKESRDFPICKNSGEAPQNSMIKLDAKDVKLGVNKNHKLYAWDNEYGNYEERVEAFKVSKYLVSNGEFMEFVQASGYENEEFWDAEGLEFLKKSKQKHPSFWVYKDGKYRYRALAKEIDMPYDWPVDVNALEAEAFCRYKSQKDGVLYQLPSEAEYRVLYDYAGLEDIPNFHESRANLNFYHYASSSPVNEFGFHALYDVVGNVWQWSRTPMRAYEGFEVHKAYDDFSVPTFDDKHALILGSSWASSGNLIAKNSRYAFRKHFFQNAGFRYVITENKEEISGDIYESDALVSQYCEFQYGATHFGVENFAISSTKLANKFAIHKTKALDLGCATGRASYELAKVFDKVEGVDFSARFVQVGSKLKDEGYVAYSVKQEGDIYEKRRISIAELGYEKLKEKVSFWQGDACNLKPHFRGYDLIMATNLIDRLYNPRLFLEAIDTRLNKEGILVITSPYTWQESSTAKEFWLGGYEDDEGNPVRSIDTLQEILGEKFELLHIEDLAFVIQESARKYQHTLSQVTVWKKK